jgi:outer membrane autotransporter protein
MIAAAAFAGMASAATAAPGEGSVYPSYLNSLPSLGVHGNDLVDRATDCAMPSLAGAAIECRASSATHVWGQADYQHRRVGGDADAGRSVSKRFSGLLGVDTRIANATFAGVDAGWLSNDVLDQRSGDGVKGDGWTIGAYADFDPGPLFVKGVANFSALGGHSTRGSDLKGSPDAHLWSAGLHGGARFPLGGSSVVAPFLDLDYVHSALSAFTERGEDAAVLTVSSGHSDHLFATAGVSWAHQLGRVVPEVELGYRLRFGSDRSRLFARSFDSPEDFALVSAPAGKGDFLAGLSVGGKLGSADLRLGYEAEFNGEVMTHSGNLRFVLPLGSHGEPPPLVPPLLPPPQGSAS